MTSVLRDDDPDVGLLRVLADDGTCNASDALPKELLLRAYREMRRLRILDARMILLQRQGRVGFYGACTGQEAVPIATGLAVTEPDWVFPALREQSVMLVRGFPLTQFVAQVFGNSGDVLKGRQMPSHHSGRAVQQVSWSSNIGPQIPQAVGTAWAMKLRKQPAITVGFMGDGCTSQPDFHTAMNFAAVYQAPTVLICQNNHWSISVPTARQTVSRTIAVKGRAYGIPSVRVDGNDLLAMYKVISEAAARARSGGGPTFIEAVTYRRLGHSSSDDPTRYRDEAEVKAWEKKDPVDRFRAYLQQRGLWNDDKEAAFKEDIAQRVNAAIAAAEANGPPADETLVTDVYAQVPEPLKEQLAEVLALEGRGVNQGAFPL